MALRRVGHSYDAIANEIGVANRGAAFKMVRRGLERCDCAAKYHYYGCEVIRTGLVGEGVDLMLEEYETQGPPIQAMSAIVRFQRLATTLANQWPDPETGKLNRPYDFGDCGFDDAADGDVAPTMTGIRRTSADIKADVRDFRAAALHAGEKSLEEVGSQLGETDTNEVKAMIDRGAHAASILNASHAKDALQDTLRKAEFDLVIRILQGGQANREWIRALNKYVTLSHQRCKLLGILPDRKRGFSFSRNDLPPSAGQEAEFASTFALLTDWQRNGRQLTGMGLSHQS